MKNQLKGNYGGMMFNATCNNIPVRDRPFNLKGGYGFLAHLAFRPCELLSSLFVRRLVRRPSSVRQHFTF
jgi:hypothetical protein